MICCMTIFFYYTYVRVVIVSQHVRMLAKGLQIDEVSYQVSYESIHNTTRWELNNEVCKLLYVAILKSSNSS